MPYPHDIGPLCAVEKRSVFQWTPLCGVEERATRLWRANLSLRQDVSLNVGDSKRPSALACKPFARREIANTVCQEKGERCRAICARACHEWTWY